MLIGNRLSFQLNQAWIRGSMIAALVLDSMLVNAATLSALSNYIVTEHLEL